MTQKSNPENLNFGILFDNFGTKGQLISKQKEDRLSFCINLEVVNLKVEIQRSFLGEVMARQSCFEIN